MSNKIILVAGIDEAGRGPLAGPVSAAAVVLGGEKIDGLDDSKKLSAKQRAELEKVIIEKCLCYSVRHASIKEIEELNILEATIAAMQRAASGLVIVPDKVLVDGNQLPDLPYPASCVVGGDATVPEIMAASVLAKQERDRIMVELDWQHPEYGFAKHKGYPTPEHIAALKKNGPCIHHRKNFKPVAKLL